MPFNWKLGLVLTSFLIVEPHSESPDSITPYDGKLVGLSDKQRREIIAPRYSQIDYVGNGIFRAWTKNPESNLEHGTERILFNYNGQKLEAKVPAGSKLVNVFWLGKEEDKNPDLLLNKLPDTTLLRFALGNVYGLCNTKGEVVLPARYSSIGIASEGLAFLREPASYEATRDKIYIFNCTQHKLKELIIGGDNNASPSCFSDGLATLTIRGEHHWDNVAGYINESGEWAIKPRFTQAHNFHNGLAAAIPANQPFAKIINKTGEVVSPEDMEVQSFCGDFAIARNITSPPARYGVVNRQFEYVIKPKFRSIDPPQCLKYQTTLRYSGDSNHSPNFYEVKEEDNQPQKVINLAGEVVSILPLDKPFTVSEKLDLTRLYSQEASISPERTGASVNHNSKPRHHKPPLTTHEVWYRPIAPSRLLREITNDDGKFDSVYWKNGHCHPINRIAMFGRFLKDYNLIGMPREKVTRLLGSSNSRQEDRQTYWLESGCLLDQNHFIEIFFKTNKVKSWTISQMYKQGKPITTNVVLDLQTLANNTYAQLPPPRPNPNSRTRDISSSTHI
jgi:hypothetical protein